MPRPAARFRSAATFPFTVSDSVRCVSPATASDRSADRHWACSADSYEQHQCRGQRHVSDRRRPSRSPSRIRCDASHRRRRQIGALTGTGPAAPIRMNNINAAASGTFQIGGDLPVHRLGFGAMRLTGDGVWGPPKDRTECIRVLRRAIELGINLIDTAESYGPHVSEEIIAEALHPYPKDLVIATKGGYDRPGPGKWVEIGRAHV